MQFQPNNDRSICDFPDPARPSNIRPAQESGAEKNTGTPSVPSPTSGPIGSPNAGGVGRSAVVDAPDNAPELGDTRPTTTFGATMKPSDANG
jgi:hypothetical protein